MNARKEYVKGWLPLVLSAAVVLLLLVLVVGGTWAHFEAKAEREQTLEYVPVAEQVYILSAEKDPVSGVYIHDASGYLSEPEGWVSLSDENGAAIPDTYALHFLLANSRSAEEAAAQTQTVALTLFATQGVADPAALSILLDDGGSTYMAVPTAVQEGSAWYNTYGPGWTYRFYNEAEEELFWIMQGGVPTFREMTLTVSGAGEEAALLTLIATVQPTIE